MNNFKTPRERFMTISSDKAHPPLQIIYNVEKIRADFPIFREPVNAKPLIYLDNAATTQKPQFVIDAMTRFYAREYASIHRGVYYLSERATESYETVREKVRCFIKAPSVRGIVFVRGTTEAINLVAQTYGRMHVGHDDEILLSHMEHHSNIVPWQLLCEEKGARLCVVPMNSKGELLLEQYEQMLSSKTRLVAIAHVSNSLGTINPIRSMIRLAHERNIPVLVDGAQAVPHTPIDVQELDCDFLAFSGHKMYGPTGIGILYAKEQLLDTMPPYQGGGEMIRSVTFEKTTFNQLPYKYEAGTPNVAGAIGLGAAIDYLASIGLDNISAHEQELISFAAAALQEIDGLRIIGTTEPKASVISFVLEGIHPHDIGTILDEHGISIRSGHHCAQPVMDFFNIPATARISIGLYNTREDIEALLLGLQKLKDVFP
jgi:cysteine desulfurase / selenocysteine lyase